MRRRPPRGIDEMRAAVAVACVAVSPDAPPNNGTHPTADTAALIYL